KHVRVTANFPPFGLRSAPPSGFKVTLQRLTEKCQSVREGRFRFFPSRPAKRNPPRPLSWLMWLAHRSGAFFGIRHPLQLHIRPPFPMASHRRADVPSPPILLHNVVLLLQALRVRFALSQNDIM